MRDMVFKALGIDKDLERLKYLPRDNVGEFGVDPFGYSPDFVAEVAPLVLLLYRFYFRAQVFGIDKVPDGRVILVANHGGQLPVDGLILATAMMVDSPKPRMVRSMVEKWAPTLPFVSWFFPRTGQVVGTPDNCLRLLRREECIAVFPEGSRGISKPFSQRYKLLEFGHGFMRLALAARAPIVPVALIGSEEQLISLHNSKTLAQLVGAPAFPLLALPLLLPVRYRLYFGDPMFFKGDPEDDEQKIAFQVKRVRSALQALIHYGLKQRRHVFW